MLLFENQFQFQIFYFINYFNLRQKIILLLFWRIIHLIETKIINFLINQMNLNFKKLKKSESNPKQKQMRPRQDSNLQSSDPKSDALSIRPRGLTY